MCRLLAVKDERAFSITEMLRPFAGVARRSREYQGHGWGCAWWEEGSWRRHRSLRPIWEDDLEDFGVTDRLLVHARSAFRDEGIEVENNMPFLEGDAAFIFNGELRGVRVRAPGRIGAEKLFHFLMRGTDGASHGQVEDRVALLRSRTRYVRACNFVLAEGRNLVVYAHCNEDRDYFTLHRRRIGSRLLVCSEPLDGSEGWEPWPDDRAGAL
ncbi:MAG: class II glutamine amidotransferase [Candidatus Polarisedimenticolia bacterium]